MSRTKNKIKVADRPAFKTLTASTLGPPRFTENEEGETDYYLEYVTSEGKIHQVQCTKGVYQDVEKEQLYRNYRVQFQLLFDEEKSIVSHINLKSKKEFLPAGFTEENIVGNNLDIKHIEASLSPESELKILRAPAEVSTSTENEILESLKKDAKAKSGDYLAGKFRVAEIRERDGYKTFFIDPTVT